MLFSIPEIQEILRRLEKHYDLYVSKEIDKAKYIKSNLQQVKKNIIERRSWGDRDKLSEFDPNNFNTEYN